MGASKTSQYSSHEIHSAQIARALAHPARIRILALIKKNKFIRTIDLSANLHLVPSTVNAHLKKLLDADLIDLEFFHNCYIVRPKYDAFDQIPYLFEHFD